MTLLECYREAVENLFAKVRNTQTENIYKAADIIADAVTHGGKIYLHRICHGIQWDLLNRGGGPSYYKEFERDAGKDLNNLTDKDVLILSSVSGRSKDIVDYTWDAMHKGIRVITLCSMEYAAAVEPVHESGKKLYEMSTLNLDNCAPAAEAMLHVEGIEAPFTAASGIASDYILWSITACTVEKLLAQGKTPGIYKSANFPGGAEYNQTVVNPQYEKLGY